MAVLNLVKVQRKDPRINIRVSEEHAKEIESVAQTCLDQIADTIQKYNQPKLPLDPPVGTAVTTDGQGAVVTPSDRMEVKDVAGANDSAAAHEGRSRDADREVPMSEPLTQEHIEAEAVASQ